VEDAPGLGTKLAATGVGFREPIIGTGSDNASDALDRRVEFKVIPC
jgi:outer membrane protein OmpA-like peptidoglycan-associated protein